MTLDNMAIPTAEVTIRADQAKPISPDLFGIFFEDINYSADGGLYAELIQNRSFAYSSADTFDWNFFTAWELIQQGGQASVALGTESPIHRNNPHYLVLNVSGSEVSLRNSGFDGIVLKAGESYNVSLFARVMTGEIGAFTVRLEGRLGEFLGAAELTKPTSDWAKYSAILQPSADDRYARFVLVISGSGSLALDVISLFPQKTFHNRANGLRADLAQVIADIQPKFIRFPGGCLTHGDGLDNMYRWKDTIGPIETRREQPNIWNYHQSVGLGYYEYFQFCEDIGAKPLPVVPAGCCCPNTGAKFTGLWEQGQQGLPMDEMPDYVQEVLDLIEWVNGSATSIWGAKRAEQGHPEPFCLEYLAVGNEDRITPVFNERFKMIYEAVKARHPEIVIIGTVGPRPSGEDFELGWQVARELNLEMVDEHVYQKPDWFWDQLQRFDAYDRTTPAVYLGEYAAHDIGRKNPLRSALAEAAYMTALERNGDIVRLSSYAPLLAKQRRTQWMPDLIYFDNVTITPSLNCYVQQLFCTNAGDTYLPTTLDLPEEKTLAVSCVLDTKSGDIILKIVSRADVSLHTQFNLAGLGVVEDTGTCLSMSGNPLAENAYGQPADILPVRSNISVAQRFAYELPAHSLSIIRVKIRNL